MRSTFLYVWKDQPPAQDWVTPTKFRDLFLKRENQRLRDVDAPFALLLIETDTEAEAESRVNTLLGILSQVSTLYEQVAGLGQLRDVGEELRGWLRKILRGTLFPTAAAAISQHEKAELLHSQLLAAIAELEVSGARVLDCGLTEGRLAATRQLHVIQTSRAEIESRYRRDERIRQRVYFAVTFIIGLAALLVGLLIRR